MTVVDISRFLTRFVAPVLLFLGILLISGLSFSYRRAKTIAGTASLALGIIGLFMALYSLSSIWWRQVLSVGIPAEGLVIGIACLRQQGRRRWIPVTGIVLGSLALLLILMNAIMLNINSVPGENIVRVIGIAAVIAGIIIYASKEQIMTLSVSGKWLRPAAVAVAAVVVLILALVQPWSGSLEPQSVLAKAYTATEGLLSYRATISGTASEGSALDSVIEFVFPDRFHAIITPDGEMDEFIVVGDKQYVKSGSMSRNMIIAFSNSASPVLSKEATLKIIDSLTGIQTLPEEKIKGVESYHYRGRYDMEKQLVAEKARLAEMESRMDADDYERMMEGLENSLNINMEIELWIGKDDNLIRQMVQTTQYPGDEGKLQTTSTMMTFYDFNEPIIIEPPTTASGGLLPGWQLQSSPQNQQERTFGSDVSFIIGGDDLTHQQISFRITITNISDEVASNLRVSLASMATNDEDWWIWNSPSQVTLKPGESETYHVSWEYDASQTSKEELDRLVGLTTILATYTTPEGIQPVELLFPDAPYPTKTPPSVPPEQEVIEDSE